MSHHATEIANEVQFNWLATLILRLLYLHRGQEWSREGFLRLFQFEAESSDPPAALEQEVEAALQLLERSECVFATHQSDLAYSLSSFGKQVAEELWLFYPIDIRFV